MAQISKGDTFTDGQQVTGARLNQLVDSSTLLVGAITDQPNITANTLQATDSTIVNDGGVLKEATIGDFLNSNLPITTSSILGATGVDLVLTPAAGQKVDIAGNIEADDINVTDDLTVGDDATISGDLVVTGGSTLTGNVVVDNGFTSNGIANFTGTLQVGGSVGYVLYELNEQTMTPWTAPSSGFFGTVFVSSSFTKPSDEIWVFESTYSHRGVDGHWYEVGFRNGSQTARSGQYQAFNIFYDYGNSSLFATHLYTVRWTVPAGVAIASDTVAVDAWAGGGTSLSLFQTAILSTSGGISLGSATVASSKFRIYKYKTA